MSQYSFESLSLEVGSIKGIPNVTHDQFSIEKQSHLFLFNNCPIGAIKIDYSESPDWAHFKFILIFNPFRKKGHGTNLVKEAERHVISIGRSRVKLSSGVQTVPFYQGLGYSLDPHGIKNPNVLGMMKNLRSGR